MERFKERAISKALQSSCRFKISAIGLNRKGDIIDYSCNHVRYQKDKGGLHAEQLLIRRNGRKLKTIIICRVNNSGDILPIEPCEKCKKIAKRYDIKIVSINPEM